MSQVIGDSNVAAEARPCRKPAWSSPPSSSSTRPVAEVAARYGVHRSWVYQLKARYDADGEAALRTTVATPADHPDRDPAGHRRADPAAAQAADRRRPGRRRGHHRLAPDPPPPDHACRGPRSTGSWSAPALVTPDPSKRPKSSYIRFEAVDAQRVLAVRLHPLPTHPARRQPRHRTWRSSPGSTTTPATPCTSPPTPGSPHRSCWPPSGRPLTCTDTPHPRSPTTAWCTPPGFAGGRGGRNPLEHELRRLDIVQKNSRPNHPTTCGKVERFQQTLKKWLRAQPVQPTTIADLQTLLDAFVEAYNHHRPHRSLPAPSHPGHRLRRPAPRPPRPATAAPTPTTGSATTSCRSKPATSPCAWPADYATSASAEPTPEPASSCSSKTSTSASSTPPPANSSASSPSTPDRDYQPTDTRPRNDKQPNLRSAGPAVA